MPRLFYNFREGINKEQEQGKVLFRFDDLTNEAQLKLSTLLKKYSTLWTLKSQISVEEILKSLDMMNPVIINPGYNGSFRQADIKQWNQHQLSRAVYWVCKRNVTDQMLESLQKFLHTPAEGDWRRQWL